MEDPDGISVHKTKLTSFIKKGRPLKRRDADPDMTDNGETPKEVSDKTPKAKVHSKRSVMDCGRRVKGNDCHPKESNAPESVIAKAFNRYAFDEDDPNSGADLHKSDGSTWNSQYLP